MKSIIITTWYIIVIILTTILIVVQKVNGMDIFDAVRANSMIDIKRILKENGKDTIINQPGPGGQTPLMNAVLTGKIQSVKYLLKQGADVTIGEKDGYTPMHGAGFQGRNEIGQLLIDHGINPLEKHADGYVPIQRACWGKEARHTETVKMFLDNGVFNEEIYSTCKDSQSKATRKVIEEYFKNHHDDL